jgi:predicted DNA binding CopG/RHH family protein
MKKSAAKPMPSLRNDAEAEQFIDSADLSEYDLSGFKPMKFEFAAKTAVLNMRLPQSLLLAVKTKAKEEGMPYTRYIRFILEQAINSFKIASKL